MYKRLGYSNFSLGEKLYNKVGKLSPLTLAGITGAGIAGTGAIANGARQDALNEQLPASERKSVGLAAAKGAGITTATLGGGLLAASALAERRARRKGKLAPYSLK